MPENRSRTITVLGCGGFIGSHLLEALLSTTDFEVLGADLSSKKIVHLIDHERFTFYETDIHDPGAVMPLLKLSGTVVSLAALCNPWLYNHTPVAVIESNFVRMYPLVQACSECNCRLVHFSTSEVYGKTLGTAAGVAGDDPSLFLLNEENSPLLLGPVHAQRWCYASAKQLLERTIFAYGYERGLDYTIVRPFNFIGPQMDFIPGIDGEGVPRVIACFMDALLHGRPLQLVDGGKNKRCFTAISDAVDATVKIIRQPDAARGGIFNIGNPGNETTIADLAGKMIELYHEFVTAEADRHPSIENVTADEFYGDGYEDSDRRVPDISGAVERLGWHPEVDLTTALRLTVEGFVKEYGAENQENGDVGGYPVNGASEKDNG